MESMAHLHLNNYDNPDIRQQSSGFDIPTGGLQQQPMVPTLLNMISQLTSLLNESYASQNINIQSQSKEHELNKKIEQLVSEVEYYKKECNRLKEEKAELREKWGKSNWCKWIEKNRLRQEKENFQKSLEVSRSKCKVLEQNVQKCEEEKTKIQQKWKESNRCKWEKIHQQRELLGKMQSKVEESLLLSIGAMTSVQGSLKNIKNKSKVSIEKTFKDMENETELIFEKYANNFEKCLDETRSRIDSMQKDLKEFQQENENLKDEKEKILHKLEDSVSHNRELEAEINKLTQEYNDLKDEYEDSCQRLDDSVCRYRKLKTYATSVIERYRNKVEENTKLQCELKECQDYSKVQDEEIHWLQEECDRLEEETAAIQQKWDETNFYNILIEKDMKYFIKECENLKSEKAKMLERLQDRKSYTKHLETLCDLENYPQHSTCWDRMKLLEKDMEFIVQVSDNHRIQKEEALQILNQRSHYTKQLKEELEEKNRHTESLEKLQEEQQCYTKQLEEELEERRRHTESLENLKEELQCSICWDSMKDPQVLPSCCHRFCKSCITHSMDRSRSSCPLCRAEINGEPKPDNLARIITETDLYGTD